MDTPPSFFSDRVLLNALRRLPLPLNFYIYHRPHMGLGGAIPAEVYFKLRRAHRKTIQPPRGRPSDPAIDMPYQIEFLDVDRRLPILARKTKAA
jgi:hypothetical protein